MEDNSNHKSQKVLSTTEFPNITELKTTSSNKNRDKKRRSVTDRIVDIEQQSQELDMDNYHDAKTNALNDIFGKSSIPKYTKGKEISYYRLFINTFQHVVFNFRAIKNMFWASDKSVDVNNHANHDRAALSAPTFSALISIGAQYLDITRVNGYKTELFIEGALVLIFFLTGCWGLFMVPLLFFQTITACDKAVISMILLFV